jgi:hypothetical protein
MVFGEAPEQRSEAQSAEWILWGDGGGMTPIEPRAGNVHGFRGGAGTEELRKSGLGR